MRSSFRTNYRPHTQQQQTNNSNTQQQDYANRYRRTAGTTMDKVFAMGAPIVALVSFLVALASLIAMLLVDVLVGQYFGSYMANPEVGWYVSLATTGLNIAIIGTALYGYREGWPTALVMGILIVGLFPVGIDMYFDGITVDIIRFGRFVIVETDLTLAEQLPHSLFRIMIAALSAVGEPLAATSVIIFPVMRELFKGVLTA